MQNLSFYNAVSIILNAKFIILQGRIFIFYGRIFIYNVCISSESERALLKGRR